MDECFRRRKHMTEFSVSWFRTRDTSNAHLFVSSGQADKADCRYSKSLELQPYALALAVEFTEWRSLDLREDRVVQYTGTVRERTVFNPHGIQDAEKEIRHGSTVLVPVGSVFQPHAGSTRDQCRQIGRIVCGTGATTKQNDTVVQHTAVTVFKFL